MTIPVGPLLVGQVAVVTGGGDGMGGGISRAFGAHGAKVAIAEIDPERAQRCADDINSSGGTALPIVADIRQPDDIARVLAVTREQLGPVDILVNNVGHYLHRGKYFHETTEEQWQELYEMNFLHVLRCTKAVLPEMVERKTGVVLTVSTVEAFRGIPAQPVYSANKAAVAHFTKSMGVAYGPLGVRFVDIAPDVTQTPQLPYDRWLTDEQRAEAWKWVPVGRVGQPDDAGGIAVFAASAYGSFLTGSTIHMDGGTLAAGGWYPTTHGPSPWTNRPFDP